MSDNTTDDRRTVILAEIFDPEVVDRIVEILNGPGGGLHRRLVLFLEPHRQHLLQQGLLVEYLAYYLEAVSRQWSN